MQYRIRDYCISFDHGATTPLHNAIMQIMQYLYTQLGKAACEKIGYEKYVCVSAWPWNHEQAYRSLSLGKINYPPFRFLRSDCKIRRDQRTEVKPISSPVYCNGVYRVLSFGDPLFGHTFFTFILYTATFFPLFFSFSHETVSVIGLAI